MTATDTASATRDEAELDPNAAALEAIEAEAKRAGVRLPRRDEDRDTYLLRIARHRGVVPPDAHITDPGSEVKTLLARAGEDELFGGSPAGRALVTAAAIWDRMHPRLAGVGELRASGRRGVHAATAALLQELQQDPRRGQRLSPAEGALLRYYASDVHQAVEELGRALDAAFAHVRAAAEAEAARPIYSDLLPAKPAPREEPAFHFVDQRGLPPGEYPGDQQLPNIGRTEVVSIPTPAALRGPRGW